MFLVQEPKDPFGAVEYIGDLETNRQGRAQVELRAIKLACAEGRGTVTRLAVFRDIKKANHVKNWILGGTFRFSTKTNDPLNGRFTIFQIQSNGSYKVVN